MLKIEHYGKVYKGGKKAVNDLSIHVCQGDIYGFIGHNGAGKTTTIRSVVGILEFEEGNIYIDGRSIKKDALECKKEIAYIPDNPDLYEYMTGIQYLNFIADIYQIGKKEREEAISRYAKEFEILSNLGDLIASYSHGMKQKVAIIAALIHKPRLLVLDEPFVGLDPKAALTLKTIMKELCAEGCAIFFSTHVLEVAEKLCNKVAIIKQGQLIASGDTDSIVKDKSLEEVFIETLDEQ